MLRIALLMLLAGVAQADDQSMTFLVTGTVVQNPYGNPGWGTPGDTLQFEYTIDPSFNPDAGQGDGIIPFPPISALAYSVNGGAFHSDLGGWGSVDLSGGYGFVLYPGNGQEISYNANTGIMLEYGIDGFGNYAKVTNFQQMGVQSLTAQAPEIDPAGLVSGLTLLIGGLLVLRGRRPSAMAVSAAAR